MRVAMKKKRKGRGYKMFGRVKFRSVDKEGIHEKVTFEGRRKGNEEASLAEICEKSISGRGNGRYRGLVEGACLPCLSRLDSGAGAQ